MDWDTFTAECHKLGEKLPNTADIVTGIARGGIIPAVLLTKQLGVKDLLTLKVRKEGDERKVVGEILTDFSGKHVLLVEDMLETGESMKVAKEYLESSGATVMTACLYTMPITTFTPDFFLSQVEEVQQFPWE